MQRIKKNQENCFLSLSSIFAIKIFLNDKNIFFCRNQILLQSLWIVFLAEMRMLFWVVLLSSDHPLYYIVLQLNKQPNSRNLKQFVFLTLDNLEVDNASLKCNKGMDNRPPRFTSE
jgi:hypothetical protein